MEQENIGNLIKEIRTKNNLSQREFADKFGVTPQAVSKWERGLNMPDLVILKEICSEYNYSLDEFLNNTPSQKVTNKKLKIILSLIIVLIVLIGGIIFFTHKDDFEFKRIESDCTEFTVTGSMAYNKDKSSIYISHITYCGKENNEVYKEIKCTLFENNNNTNIMIDSCLKKENVTIEEYLKSVKFNVDNYEASCKKYQENSLYLEIIAKDKEDKSITYQIPLNLLENC